MENAGVFSPPRLPSVGSGPRRALGISFEVGVVDFGNSIRQHEAHSICGSRRLRLRRMRLMVWAVGSVASTQQVRVLTSADSP
jgi:hypothetical protein